MIDPRALASLASALTQSFPAGRPIGSAPAEKSVARVVDARVAGDEVLVLFTYAKARHVFGIPTEIDDLSASPWTGIPVRDHAEWVDELWWRLSEEVDTGFVVNAARRDAGDHIELRRPLWPADDRFYVSVSELSDALPAAGETIARVSAWSNSPTGHPRVGEVAVTWRASGSEPVALVGEPDTDPGVSRSVVWDLLHHAIHVGADAGAVRIETDSTLAHLDVLGFERAGRVSTVDAALTGEDPEAVAALPECRNRRTR